MPLSPTLLVAAQNGCEFEMRDGTRQDVYIDANAEYREYLRVSKIYGLFIAMNIFDSKRIEQYRRLVPRVCNKLARSSGFAGFNSSHSLLVGRLGN